MGKQILFVDDERAILKSIERLFFDLDYEILVAESGEEGLNVLSSNQIDIVVSDMRMPGMNGFQFLKKVKAQYPHTSRLALSGYADEKEILDSLIDGSNSLYLFKPWDGEDLIKKIEQIFAVREIIRNPDLLNIINGLDNLSFTSDMYNAVCRLIDSDADINAIAKVIETDPSVTVSVLRVVNSAFYNVKTASVSQAITFLGLPVVKSIVLSCSLFLSADIKVPPFNVACLTRLASIANLYVNRIYSFLLNKKVPDNLSTAGLLHNIGLLMLLHYFPDKYKRVIEMSQNKGVSSLIAAEKEVFSINHAELGGYLLDYWSIPHATVECSLFYHDPLHAAVLDKQTVSIVHLASHYAWRQTAPNLAGELDTRVFAVLGATQEACEAFIKNQNME